MAMSIYSDLGQRLISLFKLDKANGREVIEAHIHIKCNDAITMDVLEYVVVDGEILAELEPIMKHYEIIEKKNV